MLVPLENGLDSQTTQLAANVPHLIRARTHEKRTPTPLGALSTPQNLLVPRLARRTTHDARVGTRRNSLATHRKTLGTQLQLFGNRIPAPF